MKTQLFIFTILVSLLLVVGATGCTTSPSPEPTQPPSLTPTPPPPPTPVPISAVVLDAAERHNAGDLDGMMAFWDDDAIFYLLGYPPTGTEIHKGKAQIRELFEENLASHAQWDVEIDSVVGEVVNAHSKNWHDFTRQIGVAPLEHSLVYVIEDGKIVTLEAILTEDSTIRLKTALAEEMPAEPAEETTAETPATELTVTIAEGTCSYDGPLALQAGEVQVTIDVQDQDKQKYAVSFFTMEPDKDFMDLMASTVQPHPPSWSHMFSFKEIEPGKGEAYTITATEGPVYVVCWSKPPDLAIGGLGPFTVQPIPATPTPSPPREIPDSDIVATFSKGKCTFDMPEILQAGELTVTLNVEDDMNEESYALSFFNLSEGKNLADLIAAQNSPSPPPWADMFSFQDALPGAIKTYNVNLEVGPVYLMCWSPERVIGSKGPIEVSQ